MPIPSGAFNAMKNYFNSQSFTKPSVGPSTAQVANYMLLNAQRLPMEGGDNPNSPSVMGRIFDILSRPNYAVANLAKGQVEGHTNPLADLISGLSGTQKTTFDKVLESAGMEDSGLRHAAGLILDIGLDPTTYIGGAGAVSKLKDLAGISKAGAKTAAELPLGGKLLQGGKEAINPEVFGLESKATPNQIPDALKAIVNPPPVGKTVEQLGDIAKPTSIPEQLALDLPGVRNPKVTIPESLIKDVTETAPVGKEIKGQQSLRFPDFSVQKIRAATELAKVKKAEDIVSGVADGNIQDALKISPPPPIKYSPRDQKLAEEIAAKFDPYRAKAEINKQFPETLNAKQQVKLYYQVREALSKQGPKSALRTNAVYKAVEDTMQKRGLVPRIGSGENVKLSNVIEDLKSRGIKADYENLKEFADNISRNSPVGQAVENLRARGAIKDSVSVKSIVDKVNESIAQTKANNVLSDVQLKDVNKLLKQFGKASARAADVSPAGVKATEGLINQAMTAGKSTAQVMLEQKSKMLDDIIAGGKTKRAEINKVVTLGLEKNFGKLPKWSVNDNKAIEFGMGRIATWWGQQDLRPATLEALASSAATAQLRGQVIGKLFAPYDAIQRNEAMRLAQGIGRASSPATAQLATQVSKLMEDLTGKVGGLSVLTRSSVDMGELNKWMRKYGVGFEFTKGKVQNPVTKEIVDLSKGSDWLDSWKYAEITHDPAQFLFKYQQAIEQATREKSVFDELGERFGSQVSGNGYRNKIEGHPYLRDYYFPDDIAKQIPRMVKDWNPVGHAKNQMLTMYDRLLSMWKTNVTIYRPGFHIRNIIGDAYMGALDGVTSIKPYRLAMKVQRSMSGAFEGFNDIDRLIEIGAASRSMKTPLPGEILFRNKSGVGFTAEQISAVAHDKGLFESFKTLEDIINTGTKGKGPFGGRVQSAAGKLTELQNANSRLAHFIDKVSKSRGSDLPKIFEDAARRSRRFHPSGLDLTDFEKTYLRRIIPFYSWMRKSTPLLLEGIVMKPGVTVFPAKFSQTMQQMGGVEDTNRDNPFPVDQLFPGWLREQGLGPWGTGEGLLGKFSNQSPPGYVMGGMGLDPLTQLIPQIQHPGKTLSSGMTPLLRIPMELMMGQKAFSGEPITGQDAKPGAMEQYIGEQIPLYSVFQSLSGITPFGGQTKQVKNSGNDARWQNFVNFLTAAGIQGTGPYIKSAQYEYRNQLGK